MKHQPVKAIFPGSFDPITNGHLDVIGRGVKLFDNLIVAVGQNPQKKELFTPDQRVEMIKELVKDIPRVTVEKYSSLTVEYAKEIGADVMLRGMRNLTDVQYEFQMAMMNRSVAGVETVFIMTSEEFGFFGLSDAVTTGSSLMPQKKNPDPLELVRGKTGRVIGNLSGWLATMKGLPSGYNKDLQEDKQAVFDTDETVYRSLRAVTAVVGSLTLRSTRTEAAASGLALATDVADLLVATGVPFREAHEVVGRMVRDLLADGRDFAAMTTDEWQGYHPALDSAAASRITARGSVEARQTPQSTAPSAVAAALAEVQSWIRDSTPGSD